MAQEGLPLLDHTQPESKLSEDSKQPPRQKPSTPPQLLSSNEQLYISSILINTFTNDIHLVSENGENEERRKLRALLTEQYLALNAHQYVFFSAFFYLQRYFNLRKGEGEIKPSLPIACLALGRKYQKGKSPNLDIWKQKLGLAFENQQVRDLEDEIIQTLQFDLEPVTRFNFMSDLFLKIQLNEKNMHFCAYLLDLSTMLTHVEPKDGTSPYFTQAEIGLSVVRLACYFFNTQQLASLPINQFGFNIQRIHECCSSLFQLLMNKKMGVLKQIRHRYKRTKFMEVSKIEFFKIQKSASEKEKDTADENQEQRQASKKNPLCNQVNC